MLVAGSRWINIRTSREVDATRLVKIDTIVRGTVVDGVAGCQIRFRGRYAPGPWAGASLNDWSKITSYSPAMCDNNSGISGLRVTCTKFITPQTSYSTTLNDTNIWFRALPNVVGNSLHPMQSILAANYGTTCVSRTWRIGGGLITTDFDMMTSYTDFLPYSVFSWVGANAPYYEGTVRLPPQSSGMQRLTPGFSFRFTSTAFYGKPLTSAPNIYGYVMAITTVASVGYVGREESNNPPYKGVMPTEYMHFIPK